MDILQAIKERHSVRSYSDRPVEEEKLQAIKAEIENCNLESGLNIQLVENEEKAFGCFLASCVKFSGVKNYFALVGKNDKDLHKKVGYYGEKLVLFAQQLGLNTCWAAGTYKKVEDAFDIKTGEKLACVIALGYGNTQGAEHKDKPLTKICPDFDDTLPQWFKNGLTCAMLAPTALNRQKLVLRCNGNEVSLKVKKCTYSQIDLGIVKLHFEIGAGKENFVWSNK